MGDGRRNSSFIVLYRAIDVPKRTPQTLALIL